MVERSVPEMMRLDTTALLAQVDLETREARQMIQGADEFPADQDVASIMSVGSETTPSELEPAGRLDSEAKVWVPSLDLDSEDLYEIDLLVIGGARPLIAIRSDDDLPREVVLQLVHHVTWRLGDHALNGDEIEDFSRDVKGVALAFLWKRIDRVEQTVRDALADDEVSAEDYEAMREYATRLARVQTLAIAVQNPGPSWKSLRPKSPYASIVTPDLHVDTFYKQANEIEADAKEAVTRMSGLINSQQVVMVQRQRVEVERFQRLVTLVGAAVLVPGLVAAGFGANVEYPGAHTRAAFWAMLLLMAASALGSYAILRCYELGLFDKLTNLSQRVGGDERRAMLLGTAAVGLATAAVVVLAC